MTPPPPNWACPFGLTVSHPREHPAPATVISREKRSLQSLRPVWMILKKTLSKSEITETASPLWNPRACLSLGFKFKRLPHTNLSFFYPWAFKCHGRMDSVTAQPFRQLRQLLSTSTPGAGALNETGWQHQSVVFSAYKSFEIKMLARIGSGLSKSIRLSVSHVFHPGNQQKLIRCKPQFSWNGTE